jgi:hypothetical protein
MTLDHACSVKSQGERHRSHTNVMEVDVGGWINGYTDVESYQQHTEFQNLVPLTLFG